MDEVEEKEFVKAIGYVFLGVVTMPAALGAVMFVASMYYLYHDQLYVIGWIVAGVTLPLALGMYLLGRRVGEEILHRKKNGVWPYPQPQNKRRPRQ